MSANAVLEFRTTQDAIECYLCHMIFSVPAWFEEQRRFDGQSFYCPAGHRQCYTESEKAKLERELTAALDRASREANLKEMSRLHAESLERSRNACRGALTRTKKRIAAGCCPCCKRHFENLGRHMKTKHPDFGDK